MRSQVVSQMEQGIELFERQAYHEAALRDCKQREASLLSNLIISAENLAVKLDQQILYIVDVVQQQSDLHSVLDSLDPTLTGDFEQVEEAKVRH